MHATNLNVVDRVGQLIATDASVVRVELNVKQEGLTQLTLLLESAMEAP